MQGISGYTAHRRARRACGQFAEKSRRFQTSLRQCREPPRGRSHRAADKRRKRAARRRQSGPSAATPTDPNDSTSRDSAQASPCARRRAASRPAARSARCSGGDQVERGSRPSSRSGAETIGDLGRGARRDARATARRARRPPRARPRAPRSPLVTNTMSGVSITPAFMNCSASPGAGLGAERDEVGAVGDLGLGLADADGLDDHEVEERAHQHRGRIGDLGEAAEPAARGHRAHEDAGVVGVGLDPGAVAEQRAARAARRRIDRDHRRRSEPRARKPRDQRVDQRRFADAGRPGQPERDALAARRARRRAARRARDPSASVSSAESARASARLPPARRPARSGGVMRRRRPPRRAREDRRLRRREPRDRHPERRAGDVVEARDLAEAHRGRIAAVLAAEAERRARGCARARAWRRSASARPRPRRRARGTGPRGTRPRFT